MGLEVTGNQARTFDNQGRVKEVIGRVMSEEPKVIAVPSELIHFVGSLTKRCKTQKALFLSQLIYWSDRGNRVDRFIFKTRKEWHEETGLSESQVADYTEEFRDFGLLETKVKKAYGNPTLHYKLKFDVFLERFRSFLQKRIQDKLDNQSEETDDSLTENTTEITSIDNSLLKQASSDTEEKVNNQDLNVKQADESSFHGQTGSNHNDAGDRPAERVLVPLDFEPTLDEKYRAIMKYGKKSPADVTKKFIAYYRDNEKRMTIQLWHHKWWDWMDKEGESVNNSELEKERLEIINKVLNDIYNMTLKYKFYLFNFEEASFYLREMYSDKYSEETMMLGLQELFDLGYFALIGEYVFNYGEYQESDEFRKVVDECIVNCGLKQTPIILAYKSPTPIKLEDLWRYDDEDDY